MPTLTDTDPALVAALRRAGCVYAEDEARVLTEAARSPEQLAVLLERRCAGEPLELVVGWAAFCGLRVGVRPGVFLPRRRSEFLAGIAVLAARAAQRRAAPGGLPARVLDLGCGSGALALVLVRQAPDVRLTATDVSTRAVACARVNLQGCGCEVLRGDLFAPLEASGAGPFDVVVANLPYVPSGELATLPPEARDHEPRQALDGGADGLAPLRRLLREARPWLRPGGLLLSETSRPQLPIAVDAARELGYHAEARVSEPRDVAVLLARPLLDGD